MFILISMIYLFPGCKQKNRHPQWPDTEGAYLKKETEMRESTLSHTISPNVLKLLVLSTDRIS